MSERDMHIARSDESMLSLGDMGDDFLLSTIVLGVPTQRRSANIQKKPAPPGGKTFTRSATALNFAQARKPSLIEKGAADPNDVTPEQSPMRYVEALAREREERIQERTFWQQQLAEARSAHQALTVEREDRAEGRVLALCHQISAMVDDVVAQRELVAVAGSTAAAAQERCSALEVDVAAARGERDALAVQLAEAMASHERLVGQLSCSERQSMSQCVAFEAEKTVAEKTWKAEKDELWAMIARATATENEGNPITMMGSFGGTTPFHGPSPVSPFGEGLTTPLTRSISGTSLSNEIPTAGQPTPLGLTLEQARQQRKKQRSPMPLSTATVSQSSGRESIVFIGE